MRHCEKLGGRSPPVRTWEEWQMLHDEVQQLRIDPVVFAQMNIWLSATEGDKDSMLSRLDHWPEGIEAIEGVWRDYYTGEELDNYTKPWPDSNLDDSKETSFNCILYDPTEDAVSSWEEWQCRELEISCPCSYEDQPILHLRGFCPDTYLEHKRYTPMQLPTDPTGIVIVGMMNYQLRHNSTPGRWILSAVIDYSDAVAETYASQESYALGKNTWTISGDNYKCSKGQLSYDIEMKLTGCKEDEFTCDDGQCVKIEKRCNQQYNCRDKSDEINCKILSLDHGYNKRVSPILSTGFGSDAVTPVSVRISMTLLKVVAIEEADHTNRLQFQITLEWKENRVTYHNLKKQIYMNALSEADINMLWLPLVVFTNTDQQESTRLGENWEWKSKVSVRREGEYERSGFEMLDETELFRGEENSLVMVQSYTHAFQCVYQLEKYPFDTQVNQVYPVLH